MRARGRHAPVCTGARQRARRVRRERCPWAHASPSPHPPPNHQTLPQLPSLRAPHLILKLVVQPHSAQLLAELRQLLLQPRIVLAGAGRATEGRARKGGRRATQVQCTAAVRCDGVSGRVAAHRGRHPRSSGAVLCRMQPPACRMQRSVPCGSARVVRAAREAGAGCSLPTRTTPKSLSVGGSLDPIAVGRPAALGQSSALDRTNGA